MTKHFNFLTSNFRIPTLLCDFYKVSHKAQYPQSTQFIYSTLTPRSNKYLPYVNEIVSFGFQAFIKEYLIKLFNENFFNRSVEEVVDEYADVILTTIEAGKGKTKADIDVEHIVALHNLGYLPIEMKIIPEGKTVLPQVPVMTIENTLPEFFWIINYFETLISCQTWQPMTSASIANALRKLLVQYADETCDNRFHVDFQAHDFSMRGMSSLESAELSGMGHLLSFVGTDTVPAIMAARHYYGNELPKDYMIGTSIPATEHSVMSSHTKGKKEAVDDEYETFRYLLEEVYPDGFVSIVSDTYDFWHNVTNVFPRLKNVIMKRNGRFVVRPDSGVPEDILCGSLKIAAVFKDSEDFETKYSYQKYGFTGGEIVLINGKYHKVSYSDRDYLPAVIKFTPSAEEKGLIECLWETFGGEVNSKGYKVLDSHIGAIYGDSINYQRMQVILSRLKEKGFASSNIVCGIGSYTYQYNSRDSLGFAVKCTNTICDGVEYPVFKSPKTDSGKKSQRGRVKIIAKDKFVDDLNLNSDFSDDLLVTIFKNGELLVDDNIETIRQRLKEE